MLHNAKNDLSSVVKLCTFAHILDIGAWHCHSPGGDIRDIRQAVLDSRYVKDPPLDHRAARVCLAALPPFRQAATRKEKTTSRGVNLMRNPVLYWDAHKQQQPNACCALHGLCHYAVTRYIGALKAGTSRHKLMLSTAAKCCNCDSCFRPEVFGISLRSTHLQATTHNSY